MILLYISISKIKKYTYKTFYQCTESSKIAKVQNTTLEKLGLQNVQNSENSDIIFSCKSKYDNKSLSDIKITNPNQLVAYVYKNGLLGSKYNLWKTLEKYYGRDNASEIMPPSYTFPNDDKLFKSVYDPNKTYVLKSEKQRQKGIKLTNNLDDVLNSRENGFVVVQQYVENPLTYKNYKLNFRVYLFVLCNSGKGLQNGYIFNDGIISYTKSTVGTKVDENNGIASFYTSKQLYDKGFPTTIKGLERITGDDFSIFFDKFKNKISLVLEAVKDKIGVYPFKYNNKSFQIFGIDFIITNHGDVYILEINIGPGMEPYNDEDKTMREKFHQNIYGLLGISDDKPDSLIKVY